MDEPRTNTDSQDSPQPKLEGNHHLPLIIYIVPSHETNTNVILSWDSQVGVLKFPQLGFSRLWRPITLHVNLQLRWDLKQSCNPHRELFNGMLHIACTQGHQDDSQLLMVRSQIGNLTPDLSFGHHLCLKCPNGSCKPILNILGPKAFQ
jgi:hypothetical protein